MFPTGFVLAIVVVGFGGVVTLAITRFFKESLAVASIFGFVGFSFFVMFLQYLATTAQEGWNMAQQIGFFFPILLVMYVFMTIGWKLVENYIYQASFSFFFVIALLAFAADYLGL